MGAPATDRTAPLNALTSGRQLDGWKVVLAPLLKRPASAAILCDLDGTLAPIVSRPEFVEVPQRAREALERIAGRYALCAVVTGRPPTAAREIVGVEGITYAGNHGYELLEPGSSEPSPNPALEGHLDDARDFLAAEVAPAGLEKAGLRVEDKGPIVALHWRGATNEAAAERTIEGIAERARARGLGTHLGRKVLEVRPPVAIDKGVAITALLGESEVSVGLFAGDDRTDVDGFRALARLRDEGALEAIVRVGVDSDEAPAEVAAEADLMLSGTEELTDVLEALAA